MKSKIDSNSERAGVAVDALVRPDYWREDFRCYGSQWGYEPESAICNLIDFARDEYRAKYGTDYRLDRDGDGWRIVQGRDDRGNYVYGADFLLEHAPRFGVIILPNVIYNISIRYIKKIT